MRLQSSGTSLICNVYNSADNLLPWIHEQSKAGRILEYIESIDTNCDLFDKKDCIILKNIQRIP